jgi:transcriptional regulator with XRE-family HTH domain
MTADRPSSLFPEFEDVPGLDEAWRSRYPYANLALAVASLRGSLGLTQTEFAARLGTTQSVIARLESGRHGIQVSLLNRISAAFGRQWVVLFAEPSEAAATDRDDQQVDAIASTDPLLEAFNRANTQHDFEAAHAQALRIARDASTPRRRLALALDAFNHRAFKRALRWSQEAMASGLTEPSREVAAVVAGRSLLALKRSPEALEALDGAGDSEVAVAARAEALMDVGRHEDAIEAALRLVDAGDPSSRAAAAFLAARVYWHADRPLDALGHIGAFRAERPADRAGVFLHGAILGYLGDAFGDSDAHRAALELFETVVADDDPESLRLHAMTTARLGMWRETIESAAKMVAVAAGDAKFVDAAARIASECLDRLGDPDDLEAAVGAAGSAGIVDEATVRSHTAFARALRGDAAGAADALGVSLDHPEAASEDDQLRVAAAYLVDDRFREAYPILKRNQAALANPQGQLFLAQAALSALDTTTARSALRRVTKTEGTAARTAAVALELVEAIEQSGRAEILKLVSGTAKNVSYVSVFGYPGEVSAPGSGWEGPASKGGEPEHDQASLYLDQFTRERISVTTIH